MTAALAAGHPGVVVGAVRLGPVDDGTNARARVGLAYARGEGPSSVFVKRSGRVVPRLALVALRALGTEARLAASGVVLPLAHPRTYAGGVDRARLGAVVVMEDVTVAGGVPHDGVSALAVDAVGAGLDGLARLHAGFPAPTMPAALGFVRPWRLPPAFASVSVASLARGIRKLGALGSDAVLPAGLGAGGLGRQFAASARLAATGPQCLLHGDPHPGNTYALAGGGTGFLDWQLARVGHWSHDVGYFLAGSLTLEERREAEHLLLERYRDAVGRAGGSPPAQDHAWECYRATPAFGLATWIHTLSFGGLQPVETCLAMITRFAAAYTDLDTARSAVAQR